MKDKLWTKKQPPMKKKPHTSTSEKRKTLAEKPSNKTNTIQLLDNKIRVSKQNLPQNLCKKKNEKHALSPPFHHPVLVIPRVSLERERKGKERNNRYDFFSL